MLLSSSGSRSEIPARYRFAGVLVDVQSARLLVDGQDVAVGALPLKLLRVVCEANGALVNRQALFDAIWPRQVISDEALTKLIGRTRELLGPYGAALVTVRGQGVRLDAATSLQGEAPRQEVLASAVAERPGTPLRVSDSVARRRSLRFIAALSAAIVLIATVAFFLRTPRDPLISPGYALRASDLQASNPETAKLVAAAFNAEGKGELVHARTMMRSAHESDSTSPVPALMLAWWDANASSDASHQWITEARARLRTDSSAYLRLMVDYFDARSAGNEVRGPVNALLDLRPQAWVLQFARAHDQLANHEFAGALNSLQQIPLDIPDAEQVADVLADRVSLGDAVAAPMVTLAIKSDAMLDACLQGRFAYSRAADGEAIDAFDRCRAVAEVRRNYAHVRDAAGYAALAAIDAGARDALQRVEGAARLCHEQNVQSCETEFIGLRAFLEARSGRADAAAASLTDAWRQNHWDWMKPPLILIALENGLPPPANPADIAQSVPRDTVFGGVADILLAWQAFAAGDREDARRLLDRAHEHGIARTYHAEDAALLESRLGGSPAPCRVDPPYPNQLRLSACVLLQILPKH